MILHHSLWDHACFQIAISLCKFGTDEPYEKVCLCYKKTEGPDVISFDTEREMLEAFQKYLHNKNIDIITGWNIFGFDLELTLHRGAGAYICGEETALISSLEGKRGRPHSKPPYPANQGLYKQPTVVNNAETLVNIPIIVEKGWPSKSAIGI